MQCVFETARASAADTVWFHEDDFVLSQDVDLAELNRVLAERDYLTQVALLRQPWFANEKSAGGLIEALEAQGQRFTETTDGESTWIEHRACFTGNPSLIPARTFNRTLALRRLVRVPLRPRAVPGQGRPRGLLGSPLRRASRHSHRPPATRDGVLMDVLVAIPWRSQPHRESAFAHTWNWYDTNLPDADIAAVDTEHEPFCLAACRNKGARLAALGEYDVVILADADTIPEREPLMAAVEAARTSGLVHLPYTEYRSLRAGGTKQFAAGRPLEACSHLVVPAACSGVLVTSPATWHALGGQDERFLGWGMEDVAFLVTHRTIKGAEFARHEGRVYALHHESATKQGPQYDKNVSLYQHYLDAAGDTDAVLSLLDGGR